MLLALLERVTEAMPDATLEIKLGGRDDFELKFTSLSKQRYAKTRVTREAAHTGRGRH